MVYPLDHQRIALTPRSRGFPRPEMLAPVGRARRHVCRAGLDQRWHRQCGESSGIDKAGNRRWRGECQHRQYSLIAQWCGNTSRRWWACPSQRQRHQPAIAVSGGDIAPPTEPFSERPHVGNPRWPAGGSGEMLMLGMVGRIDVQRGVHSIARPHPMTDQPLIFPRSRCRAVREKDGAGSPAARLPRPYFDAPPVSQYQLAAGTCTGRRRNWPLRRPESASGQTGQSDK